MPVICWTCSANAARSGVTAPASMIRSGRNCRAVSAMLAGFDRGRQSTTGRRAARGKRAPRAGSRLSPTSRSGASTKTKTSALRSAGRMRRIGSGSTMRRPAASVKSAERAGPVVSITAAPASNTRAATSAAGERQGILCPQSSREIRRRTITHAISRSTPTDRTRTARRAPAAPSPRPRARHPRIPDIARPSHSRRVGGGVLKIPGEWTAAELRRRDGFLEGHDPLPGRRCCGDPMPVKRCW